MAYIGYQPSQLATAPFAVNTFTGDGSTTTFTLSQAVPGANEAMVEVVVENVQQNPVDAYTISGGTNTSLVFSEAPASGVAIYVIHKGEGTYNLQPSTGSVTSTSLDPVLRNFTIDTFTGNGSATTYTLTDTPYSANSIIVTVDGILQTATTNYTVSGTTLSFGTDAPASGAAITVLHLGFSTGNKSVADGTITPTKISSGGPSWNTNGALTVTGSSAQVMIDKYGAVDSGFSFRKALGTAGSPTAINAANNRIGYLMGTAYYSGATSGYSNTVNISYYTAEAQTDTARGSFMTFETTAIGATSRGERMRLDDVGNLGLGTGSPTGKLDISATTDGQLMTQVRNLSNGTSAYSAFFMGNDTNATAAYIGLNSSTNTARGGGVSSLNIINGLNGPVTFGVGGTERMRIDGSGNVGIATTSPSTYGKFAVVGDGYFSGLLTLGGGQLKFPATQSASADANTLDDYEEGSWTPVLFATGVSGVTYARQIGRYTKVGNVVTIMFTADLSSKGTGGSGQVSITGLPFASANNGASMLPNYTILVDNLSADLRQIYGQIVTTDSSIGLIAGGGSTGSHTGLTWANLGNTSVLRCGLTYLAST